MTSNKQKAFIEEYLKDFNATQAAIRAGYSEKTARSQGHRLLTNVDVSEAIQQRLSEKRVSADEALQMLSEIIRGDLGEFVNNFGMIDVSQVRKEGKTRLIKKWKTKTVTINGKDEDREVHTEDIELYDRLAAIDKILRVEGKYKDSLDINVRSYNVDIE